MLSWRVGWTPPGAVADPSGLDGVEWRAATWPLTAAAVWPEHAAVVDDLDWWWQAESDESGYLTFGGVATVSDGWLTVDGEHLHLDRVESMFSPGGAMLMPGATFTLRCASLTEALKAKRPRPRWKAGLVSEQRLRWFRTSLTGRMPGFLDGHPAVGPWRPVGFLPSGRPMLARSRVVASGSTVVVTATVFGLRRDTPVTVRVGEASAAATVSFRNGPYDISAEVQVPDAPTWWPHTHGESPLLDVSLDVGGEALSLGRVAFRSVEADTSGGRFVLLVNGIRVFARGALWSPLTPDGSARRADEVRESLQRLKDAGFNLVRVPGTTVWAGREVGQVCDELGLLLWQDVPLAAMDTPDDPDFVAQLSAEVRQALGDYRPAVLCGGAEVEQAAAMQGLPLLPRDFPVQHEVLPGLVPEGVVYVAGSPTGGTPPFRTDTGIAQYFGVGAYRRPFGDIRRSSVSFAAECFAFSIPPDRRTMLPADPAWAQGIPRDRGADWDFADVSRHYAQKLFGRDDADAQSAAAATVFEALMAEWRRPGSGCGGAVAILAEDVVPGPGWGLVDSAGRPKSAWWAARRAAAPLALLLTDEGLNGLALHLVNDGPAAVSGELTLQVFDGARLVCEGAKQVDVPAHGAATVGDADVLGGWRDLTHAYRFGAPAGDVVLARFGELTAAYLPLGPARGDAGLTAERGADTVTLRAEGFAQFVVVELDDAEPPDNWFHLAPGETRVLQTGPVSGGTVRALNSAEVRL